MAAIPRFKPTSGPALFSAGFRPFFLFGAIYAGVAIGLWLPLYFGDISIATAFAPRDWHMHEMLYGFVVAIVTGFLLTAIPNWTGRMPLQGWPLVGLTIAWLAGRLAIAFSALIGAWTAAAIDIVFLLIVITVSARELSHGASKHNMRLLAAIGVLVLGNIAFHVEAIATGSVEYGARIGIAGVIALIMLIGGRIIPSFTRNWLARENPGPLPVSPSRFDMIAIAVAAVSLVAWIGAPETRATGAALILAAFLHAIRLARWRGGRAWRDRLVLALHVAYFFVPLGFLVTGLAALGLAPISAGVHIWAIGAVGTMTLAVMTRASLGHTGRALIANPVAQSIYTLIVAATIARACAAFQPQWSDALLIGSGVAWILAYIGFALAYGPILARPRAGAPVFRKEN